MEKLVPVRRAAEILINNFKTTWCRYFQAALREDSHTFVRIVNFIFDLL
jgi:hypothetical protein